MHTLNFFYIHGEEHDCKGNYSSCPERLVYREQAPSLPLGITKAGERAEWPRELVRPGAKAVLDPQPTHRTTTLKFFLFPTFSCYIYRIFIALRILLFYRKTTSILRNNILDRERLCQSSHGAK